MHTATDTHTHTHTHTDTHTCSELQRIFSLSLGLVRVTSCLPVPQKAHRSITRCLRWRNSGVDFWPTSRDEDLRLPPGLDRGHHGAGGRRWVLDDPWIDQTSAVQTLCKPTDQEGRFCSAGSRGGTVCGSSSHCRKYGSHSELCTVNRTQSTVN